MDLVFGSQEKKNLSQSLFRDQWITGGMCGWAASKWLCGRLVTSVEYCALGILGEKLGLPCYVVSVHWVQAGDKNVMWEFSSHKYCLVDLSADYGNTVTSLKFCGSYPLLSAFLSIYNGAQGEKNCYTQHIFWATALKNQHGFYSTRKPVCCHH